MRPFPEPIDFVIQAISANEPYQIRVDGADDDYIDALTVTCEGNSGELPPVILRRVEASEGPKHFIIDGHQRVIAHERAHLKTVRAIVVQLSSDNEAEDLAWQSNLKNAKSLTFQDRVAHARRLAERQPPPPDAEIARICGIGRTTAWRLTNDVSRKQRGPVNPIVVYLRRVAFDPTGWASTQEAADAIRAAVAHPDIDDFARRLGGSALAALDVAEELGFSQSPDNSKKE